MEKKKINNVQPFILNQLKSNGPLPTKSLFFVTVLFNPIPMSILKGWFTIVKRNPVSRSVNQLINQPMSITVFCNFLLFNIFFLFKIIISIESMLFFVHSRLYINDKYCCLEIIFILYSYFPLDDKILRTIYFYIHIYIFMCTKTRAYNNQIKTEK